jgi:hypothetical protein
MYQHSSINLRIFNPKIESSLFKETHSEPKGIVKNLQITPYLSRLTLYTSAKKTLNHRVALTITFLQKMSSFRFR